MNHGADKLVFSSNRRNGKDTDLYVLDLKSGTSRMLMETKGEFWHAEDWSPDDSKLLLLRTVSVNESYPAVLEVQSRDRKMLPPLAPGRSAAGSPRFMDDGRIIVSTDAQGEFQQIAVID